ncbi:hypothetical protein AB0C38_08430 [Amycolatopsis sp. NPDC048633]|uniref:hypothetical protein n=1 Tax=Amycolatopsis sp. NPDC048633 TaxID=3157095 RepID=UPI0033E76BDC
MRSDGDGALAHGAESSSLDGDALVSPDVDGKKSALRCPSRDPGCRHHRAHLLRRGTAAPAPRTYSPYGRRVIVC